MPRYAAAIEVSPMCLMSIIWNGYYLGMQQTIWSQCMDGGWMLGQRNGIHNAWGMDLVEEWVAIPLPPHAL